MGIRLLIGLVLLLLLVGNTYASRQVVTLARCVDGDTAYMMVAGNEISVRFLAIETPEIDSDDPFALIASEFTCRELSNAELIEIEQDPNAGAHDRDRYNRLLRWVYVDGDLLQLKIIERGYGQIAYIRDDYKYNDELQEAEALAKENRLGIWQRSDSDWALLIIFAVIALATLLGASAAIYKKLQYERKVSKGRKDKIELMKNKY